MEFAEILKQVPPSMMITCAEAEAVSHLKSSSPTGEDPGEIASSMGIAQEQVRRYVMAVDVMAMFTEGRGLFVRIDGSFSADEVLRSGTWQDRGEDGGFLLRSRQEKGAQQWLAIRDGLAILGLEPDVRQGLELIAGRGASVCESKGVADALRHASGELLVLLSMPKGTKPKKGDGAMDAMAVSMEIVPGAKQFASRFAISCPSEGEAEKSLTEFRRKIEAKKGSSNVKVLSLERAGTLVEAHLEGTMEDLMKQMSAEDEPTGPAPLEADLDSGTEAEPAPGAVSSSESRPLENVRILGVRLVRWDDEDDVRPFNESKGLAIAVCGDVPPGTVGIKEARYSRAVADTGENLAAKSESGRRISFPKLNGDRKRAHLEISLAPPGETASGFREISGVLTCLVAGRTRDVDLGFAALEVEAAGKELGAVIQSIEGSSWNEGEQSLSLTLEVPLHQVESIRIRDAKGGEVKASRSGYSAFGDQCTLTYSIEGRVPADGAIVARLYTDLREVEAPFAVTDVDFLGRPSAHP